MVQKRKTYFEEKPEVAINWSVQYTLKIIQKLIGKEKLLQALDIETFYPSPLSKNINSEWIKNTKIIGINPRIAGSYFNIVKYALTFPESSIHIMPVWEAGCDGSIYARVNWKLSDAWIDKELVEQGYETPEKQLKLVVNILHALGKNVGFDAVGHTDKFSEEVFIIPECFEWIKLNSERTKQIYFKDAEEIYPLLKNCIIEYLKENNNADGTLFDIKEDFYSENIGFDEKVKILFGSDLETRTRRRIELMNKVRSNGFETIPVTEHSPCRPIVFKEIVKTEEGDYADFAVPNKLDNAKIFNSITPYRWYKIDKNGYPDINKPVVKTFEYFIDRVSFFQETYNFDFLRGDMAHNQISHSHASSDKNEDFDNEMWRQVKENIKKRVPYFATFAEAFFNKYYIDGCKDLENKSFDIALGYSNFLFLNNRFVEIIKTYHAMSEKYNFAPCITSITNDSDQLENNKFHQSPFVNELRYFIQMFLPLPGYTGMGFEQRNLVPKEDCEYSGVYTNYKPKKYKWGSNSNLFKTIAKIRKKYEKLGIKNYSKAVFVPVQNENLLMWIIEDTGQSKYLCLVNFDTTKPFVNIDFELDFGVEMAEKKLVPIFSLKKNIFFLKTVSAASGYIDNVEFGDARIYKIENKKSNCFNKKNKNQILMVTTEYSPYAKSGGLADYCADFSKAYKQKYYTDIRIMMPLYNSNYASFQEGNSFIELYKENEDSIRYEITKTGIKTDYEWGIFESSAELYKIKNPINNIIVYLVYSPAFSKQPKEYSGNLFEFSAAYTVAVCKLLKELKGSSEKFNPYIVITQDYMTANIIPLIRNYSKIDRFYENIRCVHLIHNIAIVGKLSLYLAFLLFFSRQQINKICEHNDMKKILNILKVQFKISDSKNPHLEVLKYIYFNIDKFKDNNNEFIEIFFSILMKLLQYKTFDNFYNVTEKALECSNYWITVSENMYNELISNKYKSIIENYFEKYKSKGCGILSGIDIERYNAEDKNVIKYPYNCTNFTEEKFKNKLFLQSQFSKESPKENDILGYLNINQKSILLLFAARAEVTKGFDIIKNVLPELFNKYEDVQIILAGTNLIDKNNEYFKNKTIKKYIQTGKFLVINKSVNINPYLAAADFLLTPSYYETCGLTVMQALRFGTIPVSSLTGCADKVITTPAENLELANGFKTETSLYENPKGAEIYKSLLFQALNIYIQKPELKNKIIFNAMNYDLSWNEKKVSLYNKIFKSI